MLMNWMTTMEMTLMRDILFRGKRKENGEWVFGDLIREPFGYCIQVVTSMGNAYRRIKYVIAEETVGQYTGIKDKNGKMIWEGDIVAQSWYDFDEPSDDAFGEVMYCEGDCSFSILDSNKNEIMTIGQGCAYHWEAEVIGNIHDNPELLERGE